MLRQLPERFHIVGGALLDRRLNLDQQIVMQLLDSVERLLLPAQLRLLLGIFLFFDGQRQILVLYLLQLLVALARIVDRLRRLSLAFLCHLRATQLDLRQQFGDRSLFLFATGGGCGEQFAVQIFRYVRVRRDDGEWCLD